MRIPGAALGALLVVSASAIFGSVGIVIQAAVATGFALPVLLAARFLATAGTVGSLSLAKGEHRERGIHRPGRMHWAAFGLGLASLAQTGCYFAAMTRIDLALVLALHFTFPAIVLIVEAVLARRLPTSRQTVSCLLALVGVALIVLAGGASGADPLGLLFAGGSGVAYSAIVVGWARVLQRIPAASATAFQSAGLGVAWLVACAVTGVQFGIPGLHGLGWLAFIVLFCSVLPMLLLSAGTVRVGPVAASTLATAEPVVGAVLAAILLHQTPTALTVLGAALIVFGSFVVVAPAPAQGKQYAQAAGRRIVRAVGTPARSPRPVAEQVLVHSAFATRPHPTRRVAAVHPGNRPTRRRDRRVLVGR